MDTTVQIAPVTTYRVVGADPEQLNLLRCNGMDHHGLSVMPFVDQDGDWALRCCLTDSRPGDRLAIVGWSPFPWNGAYRVTGPAVIHADRCPRASEGRSPQGTSPDGTLPVAFEERRQILRAYDTDHLQIYDLARLVEPGEGLADALTQCFADPRTDLVQSFNVLAGCWSFTARRRV